MAPVSWSQLPASRRSRRGEQNVNHSQSAKPQCPKGPPTPWRAFLFPNHMITLNFPALKPPIKINKDHRLNKHITTSPMKNRIPTSPMPNEHTKDNYWGMIDRLASAVVTSDWMKWMDTLNQEDWPPQEMRAKITEAATYCVLQSGLTYGKPHFSNSGCGLNTKEIIQVAGDEPTDKEVARKHQEMPEVTAEEAKAILAIENDVMSIAWRKIAGLSQAEAWSLWDCINNTFIVESDLFPDWDNASDEQPWRTGSETNAWDVAKAYIETYLSYGVFRAIAVVGLNRQGQPVCKEYVDENARETHKHEEPVSES